MRTEQQRAGDAAEDLVARHLELAGWRILGRRQRVGRHEVDLVAFDPAEPSLVIVEVRWRGSRDHGLPEETFDWRKRQQLRLARRGLLAEGLAGQSLPPGLPVRVDLVAVEPSPAGSPPRLRHHRHALGG